MAGQRILQVIIGGDPKGALAAIGAVDSSSGSLANSFQSVGGAATAGFAIAGAAAIGVGAALFNVGATFDDVYDGIRTTTGATGEELEGLKDDFRAVVAEVPASFGDAGDAIASVNQKLELTGKPLQTVSEQFLVLSRITGTDLAGNVEAGTTALQNWGVAAEEQSGILDYLYEASQESGMSFADLSSSLASNGTVFRALGMDISAATVNLAGMAKAGIDSSEVMPALAKVVAVAAKEGRDAKDVWFELNRRIREAPDDAAAAQVGYEMLGGKVGGKFAELVRSGKLSLDEFGESLANNTDTILGAGEDTEDFGEKWTQLKNQVFLQLEPIATRVFDAIGNGMDTIGPILTNVVIPAFDGFLGVVSKVGTWMADNQPIVIGFAAGIAALLVPAIISWGIAAGIAAVNTVIMLAPIIAIVAAFGLLGAGIALIITHFDVFKNAASVAFGFVRDTVAGVFNWVSDNWPLLLTILTGPIGAAVVLITRNWDTIKSGISAVKTWIGDRVGEIAGFFQALPGKISGFFTFLGNVIKQPFEIAFNAVKTLWNATVGGFGFKVPSWIPGVGGKEFRIPEMAAGGIVTGPTTALIGEGGQPEVVFPLDKLQQFLGRDAGGSSGRELHVHVHTPAVITGARDLIALINQGIDEGLTLQTS